MENAYCSVDGRLIKPDMARHVCPSCSEKLICDDCFRHGETLCPQCRAEASPAENGLSPSQCRSLEINDLDRAGRKLAESNGRKIFSPAANKEYRVKNWAGIRTEGDRSDRVKEAVLRWRKENGVVRNHEEFPRDEYRTYGIGKSFFSRKNKVAVTTMAVSPVGELIEKGYAESPLGESDIARIMDEFGFSGGKDGVFRYIGLYSTTGWAESLTRAPAAIPSGPDYRLWLVEKKDGKPWKTFGADSEKWEAIKWLFDPVTLGEYAAMAWDYVCGEDLLLLGPVLAGNVAEALEIDLWITERCFRQLASERDGIVCDNIQGNVVLVKED